MNGGGNGLDNVRAAQESVGGVHKDKHVSREERAAGT